jgi:hypothetical protein
MRHQYPDGQLFVSLRGTDSHPAPPAHALERLLRALGAAGPAIPQSVEEQAELYRDLLAGRRVLIVLDDAFDEEQLRPLLPGSPSCGVMITSRIRITGLPGCRQADLDVLTEDQAVELLGKVIGRERVAAESAAARAVAGMCGLLPMAVRIAAARLAARPHWAVGDLAARLSDERRRLDELAHRGLHMRSSIADAYERLRPDAQVLFRLLSMLDTADFPRWVAAPLLDIDLPEAEELLEELVDVRLLEAERLRGQIRYHFSDLVRMYGLERLEAEEALPRSRLTGAPVAPFRGLACVASVDEDERRDRAQQPERRHLAYEHRVVAARMLPVHPAVEVRHTLAQQRATRCRGAADGDAIEGRLPGGAAAAGEPLGTAPLVGREDGYGEDARLPDRGQQPGTQIEADQ